MSYPEIKGEVNNSNMKSHLKYFESVKLSPKDVNNKTVLRREIKQKSPKSPRSNACNKNEIICSEKQRHLVSAKVNDSNVVSKLIDSFEQNLESVNCLTYKNDKNIEFDQKCIKKGIVKNAFDLLMLKKGAEQKCKTPRKKSVKRLESRKTTPSQQKRIDKWVRK